MKAWYPKPSDKVSEFVQSILIIEHGPVASPFVLPLFANGKPTLLFQTAKGRIRNATNTLTLFGQTILPDTLTINEPFTLIAYFFKPYSLTALFGLSPLELTDHPIDLNYFSPSVTKNLQEQILNASSTERMIALMDQYLSGLMAKIKKDIRLIKYATEKIASNPGKKILTETQQALHLTERTFQRMFENHIGISPNQYRRIVQFNAAFEDLNRRKFKQLTELAFKYHYADQSHYIRAFKEFTHLTPKDYLNFGNAG